MSCSVPTSWAPCSDSKNTNRSGRSTATPPGPLPRPDGRVRSRALFFLRRKPSFVTARQIVGRLADVGNACCNSTSVRSGCSRIRIASRGNCACRSGVRHRVWRRGAISPVSRRRFFRRSTHARLTAYFSATSFDAMPASLSLSTRVRKSREYAAISALLPQEYHDRVLGTSEIRASSLRAWVDWARADPTATPRPRRHTGRGRIHHSPIHGRHRPARPRPGRRRLGRLRSHPPVRHARQRQHWRLMPPNKPASVATAQSWPNAPAAVGRARCYSMVCSTRPLALRPRGGQTRSTIGTARAWRRRWGR